MESGREYGLFMAYDSSKLSPGESAEAEALHFRLTSPDLGRRDTLFAFASADAEAEHSRLIELAKKAALGVPFRRELNPNEFVVLWTDGEQVALLRRET